MQFLIFLITFTDYGSELTFGDGTVLAGNAALMRRRRNLHIGDSVVSKVAVQTPGHAIVNFSKVKTVHNDSIPKKTINDVTNRSRQVIAPSKDISDAKRSSIFLNFTLSEEQKSALKLSATPSNNFADRCKTHELGTDSSSSSVSDSETSSKKPLCRSGLFDLTGGLHAIEAWAAEESSESPKSEVGTQKVVEFPDPLRRSELKTTYEDPLNSPDLCSTLPSVSDERCTEDQYKGDNDMDDDADLEYRFADIRHPPKNYIRIKPSGTEPDSELNMNLIRGLKSKPSSMCPYTNFKSTINTTVSTRRRPIGNVDTPTDT